VRLYVDDPGYLRALDIAQCYLEYVHGD
jgi:hypothetical protein